MKYQIYLSKESSEIVEGLAKASKRKPVSLIKELVEGCLNIAVATIEATEKEVSKHGEQQSKSK